MKIDIKNKFRDYLKKNSRLKIAADILFYILIILLLIPGTRRDIISTVKKITLMKPSVKEDTSLGALSDSDFLFRFESMEGKTMTLADYRGEILFINFWATWCPPCRAEMPSIQRLYDEYQDKIKFLLITGEDFEPVNEYKTKFNYTFPILFQRSNLPPSFNVTAIPHTYLINREGNILMSKTGAAKWDSKEFMEFLDRQLDL
jgi:thiol-disulfide isomerase/thioredoxin